MKKSFEFEYTKQSEILGLFGLTFLILIVSCYLVPVIFGRNIFIGIISILLVSSIFFLVFKNRLQKTGIALLSDSDLQIDLNNRCIIPFKEIRYYYIYNGKNGIVFILGFIDNNKFKLTANNNFCNTDILEQFLADFKSRIEKFKSEHQLNIVHLESVFAKKNTIYVLSFVTILAIAGLIFAPMPLKIIPISISLSLTFAWLRYFILRRRNKITDI